MKTKTSSRSGTSVARLEPLEKIFVKLNPEAEPGDLAAEMVRLLAAPGCVEGARIWKLVDGVPAVWQESGKLPVATPDYVEQVLKGKYSQSGNGRASTWALGRGTTPVGVLEIASKSKLDEKTRSWLELVLRYAEVALESSERRSAVIELSTIVEATKRLNSTLDLAELLNIILGLTTRYSGAERGTVFLVDRDKQEIWSLVGLGLEQHEIRLPITKGIAGWVAQHGEMVNLADAYADPRFESEVDLRLGYRTRSLLCLPIRNKAGETIGVLQLLNKKTGPFSRARREHAGGYFRPRRPRSRKCSTTPRNGAQAAHGTGSGSGAQHSNGAASGSAA